MTGRALGAVVLSYLALSLALGVSQQSWLWAHGQHATPQQWRLHDRLERRGQIDHHRHDPNHPGHGAEAGLLETDLSAAPSGAVTSPLDGTACALHVPAEVGTDCMDTPLGRLSTISPPTPPLSPPRIPPRIG